MTQTAVDVSDVFITEEIERRPVGGADYLREKLALQDLALQMAEHPAQVLPRLVEQAMEICEAASAGISLYEPQPEGAGIFRWHHLTGVLARFEGATTPRDFSPCGTCIEERRAVLSKNPERVYGWIADAGIVVPEVLLVPLHAGAQPLGTLWIVAHEGQIFNAGHARVMGELAAFAALAFRMVEHERDLTLALDQQQAVSREMSHRVKNLFAIAGGLVSVSARASATPKDMAAVLSGRLNALARAHGIVRKSFVENAADLKLGDLTELVHAVLLPYKADGGHNVAVSGPDMPLSERAINALALVLHELATNAVKYGAFKDDAGKVAVTWTRDGDVEVLSWRESGGPAIAGEPSRKGFGSEIAGRSVEQLGGTLTYDWHPDGLQIKIRLPVARLA